MIANLALVLLAILRKRIKMNAEQSEVWNKFVTLIVELF